MHALIWMGRDGITSGSMACEMENSIRLMPREGGERAGG